MSSLVAELEEAEARVDQLKRQIRAGKCADTGHDWVFLGGMNAGCGPNCGCSKCGDCDYGDTPERAEVIERCRAYGEGN